MYDTGMQHFREREFESARQMFRKCQHRFPDHERAYISLAQMEKNVSKVPTRSERHNAEMVLKDGLYHNPRSAAIMQAWGLHLLQEQTDQADLVAYGLLRTASLLDPVIVKGVMKWKRVKDIGRSWRCLRQADRRVRRRNKILASLACGSSKNGHHH